jgi:uncharacterized protein (DUF433 family)
MAVSFDPLYLERDDALLLRITASGGRAVLRSHDDVAVEQVLGMLAEGMTPESIVRGHAGLEVDDIRACLVYARRAVYFNGTQPSREGPGRD